MEKELRILVVEDLPSDAELVVHEIKKAKIAFTWKNVYEREEYLKALSDFNPDIVLSDYSMPGFDGMSALKLLRGQGSEIPFIIITGAISEETAVECMRAGADDYLLKDRLVRLPSAILTAMENWHVKMERKSAVDEVVRLNDELEKKIVRRTALIEAIRRSAEKIMRAASWKDSIRDVLAGIGGAIDASRAYVFENHREPGGPLLTSQRFAWAASGTKLQENNPRAQNIPWIGRGLDEWHDILSKGGFVYRRKNEISRDAFANLPDDVISIAIFPIIVNENWWGIVGFDECTKEREWQAPELDSLKTAASIIGAAIRREIYQDALRKSEERYRLIVEYSTEIIFSLDSSGAFSYVSPGLKLILDRDPSSVIGKTFEAFTHPDDISFCRALLINAVQTHEGIYDVVFKAMHKDRTPRWLSGNISPVIDTKGELISFVGVFNDITARKKAEDVLAVTNRLLKLSETTFRTISDSSLDAIIMMDGNGNATFWNPAAEKIFGYSAEEMIGKSIHDILAPPDMKDNFSEKFPEFKKSGAGAAVNRVLELVAIRKDGTVFPIEIALAGFKKEEEWVAVATIRDITARKKGEEALKGSEKKYRQLVETLQEGIWAIDKDANTTFVNPRMSEMLGYDIEEMLGKPLFYFMDERGVELAKYNMERRRQGISEQHDFEFLRKDGSRIIATLETSPITDETGNFIGALAGVVDITKRKMMEEALRESEERYRSLYAESRDAIMLTTPEGGFFAGNPAAVRLFACRDETDFTGRTPASLSPERQPDGLLSSDKAKAMMQLALEKGSNYFEWTHRKADGTDFPATVLLSRLGNDKSRLLQATVRDITEQKKAEEELQRYRVYLEELVKERTAEIEKEKEYHLILGQAAIAFAEASSETDLIKSIADWLMRLTGGFITSVSKYLPSSNELAVVHVSLEPEKREEVESLIGNSLMGMRFALDSAMKREMLQTIVNRPTTMTELTWGMVPPEASESLKKMVGFQSIAAITMYFRNSIVGTACSLIKANVPDVPDAVLKTFAYLGGLAISRREAEEERLEIQRQLLHSQNIESLNVLTGGIAHEFNNLLQGVIGNLHLSLLEPGITDTIKGNLKDADLAAKRATELTRQMLTYTGRGRFTATDLNLGELARNVARLQLTGQSINVEMAVELPRDLPSIKGDHSLIRQVVSNLVANSMEAIEEKPGKIKITAGIQECDQNCLKASLVEPRPAPGTYVYLEVMDSGFGMDERTKGRLFEPFFSTKFMGRGLGLAAVSGIMRSHKGAIFVESEPRKGTKVRVLFPVSKRQSG